MLQDADKLELLLKKIKDPEWLQNIKGISKESEAVDIALQKYREALIEGESASGLEFLLSTSGLESLLEKISDPELLQNTEEISKVLEAVDIFLQKYRKAKENESTPEGTQAFKLYEQRIAQRTAALARSLQALAEAIMVNAAVEHTDIEGNIAYPDEKRQFRKMAKKTLKHLHLPMAGNEEKSMDPEAQKWIIHVIGKEFDPFTIIMPNSPLNERLKEVPKKYHDFVACTLAGIGLLNISENIMAIFQNLSDSIQDYRSSHGGEKQL